MREFRERPDGWTGEGIPALPGPANQATIRNTVAAARRTPQRPPAHHILKFLPRYTFRTASLSMISFGCPLVSTRPSLMM